jgi:hypothetical protein
MQLECSDESVAHSVGLQSTPAIVLAAVEGREILGAVTTSAAVEDNGAASSITIMSGLRRRRLRRVRVSAGAWLDRQGSAVQATAEVRRPRARPDHRRLGLDCVVSVIEGTERNTLRTNRRRADGEAGIANT